MNRSAIVFVICTSRVDFFPRIEKGKCITVRVDFTDVLLPPAFEHLVPPPKSIFKFAYVRVIRQRACVSTPNRRSIIRNVFLAIQAFVSVEI